MGLLQFRSIQSRLVILSLAVAFAGIFLLTGIALWRVTSMENENIMSWSHAEAGRIGAEVQARLERSLGVMRQLARSAEALDSLPEEQRLRALDLLVRSALGPDIKSAYVTFERGAYFSAARTAEGKHFSIAWITDSAGNPKQDGANGDYDLAADEEWYHKARDAGHEVILNPYYYTYKDGSAFWMTSLTTPLYNRQGKFIGVAGIDITLNQLQNMIAQYKPADGYVIMVGNNGARAAHKKTDLLGKTIGDDVPEHQAALLDSIRQGKSYALTKKTLATGQMALLVFKPIHVGQTGTPWSVAAVLPLSDLLRPVRRLQYALAGLGVLSLGIMAVLIWLLGRSVAQPVQRLALIMRDIAEGEGDLTQRIPQDRVDELGALAQAFNTFATKIQQVVLRVRERSASLAGASEELNAQAQLAARTAEGLNDQGHHVASAVEEAAAGATAITNASESLALSMSSVAQAINSMQHSLQSIARSCDREFAVAREASKQAEQMQKQMDDLASAAEQVVKVVDLIEDIAEQINLLALNAAIEAATAGEAGKGFAVVAGEVKELAKQTTEAIGQIDSEIQAMRANVVASKQGIGGMARVIEEVNAVSRDIVREVEQQNVFMGDVSRVVREANGQTQQISANIREVSQGFQSVASAASEMGSTAAESKNSASELLAASKDLAGLSADLDRLVKQFKV